MTPTGQAVGGLGSMNVCTDVRSPGRSLWIGGPTAAGKSEVALELAELVDGEIVSVDSMQVYRGLDIGSAKPSAADRRRVPHHLLDVAGLSESFSAGAFVDRAVPVIADIFARGRTPVLCGGTGLYYKALLEGLGTGRQPDPVLREELESMPLPAMVAELGAKDPLLLARIDFRNRRRVIRALEQVRLGGGPASHGRAVWRREPREPLPGFYALRLDPAYLRQRISDRVTSMLVSGLLEETRGLLAEGLAANRTAMQAIGYRQIVEYVQGARGWIDTVALIEQKTWQFARRQRGWFERQLPARSVRVDSGQTAAEIARHIVGLWKRDRQDAKAKQEDALIV